MRKCKVVIGHEDLLIWNQKGEHTVIPNSVGEKQRSLLGGIPIHAIHCDEEATEHHTEIHAIWYGGAHAVGALVNGIVKQTVDIAFCPKHNEGFTEEQRRLKEQTDDTTTQR